MSQAQQLLGGTLCLDFVNDFAESPPEAELAEPAPGSPGRSAIQRFRISLRRLLTAEAGGLGADPNDLSTLNRILVRAGARRGLIPTVRGYGWGWLDDAAGTERLLWPIAFSAAHLLEGPDLSRLKLCDGCGRLFLDASRNRSRRWCDMQGCGNRAKVARHRARKD